MLARLMRSIRRRGVFGTLERYWSFVEERFYDLHYGIDTVAFVKLESVSINSPNVTEGHDYQPTRLRPLRRVLGAINPGPKSVLVDYGCGKARTLLVAAERGFQRCVGIEFVHDLCTVARSNVGKYLKKTGLKSDIQIVEGDATEYVVGDDQDYFFFFNPFTAGIMAKVLQRIADSVARADRQVYIIYNNPKCGDTIEQHGFLPVRQFENGEVILYTNVRLSHIAK